MLESSPSAGTADRAAGGSAQGVLIVQVLLPQLITQFEQLTDAAFLAATRTPAGEIQPSTFLADLENNLPEHQLEQTQPVGFQLLGVAGDAANGVVQVMLASLLAVLLALIPHPTDAW